MNTFQIVLLLFLAANLKGCERQSKNIDPSKIEGKWKLIGQYLGLPDGYVDIEAGHELSFNKDGTFIKGKDNCNHGKYEVFEGSIVFRYDCDGKEKMLSKGVQRENFTLVNGILRLVPTYKSCDEGCYYEYKKISNN